MATDLTRLYQSVTETVRLAKKVERDSRKLSRQVRETVALWSETTGLQLVVEEVPEEVPASSEQSHKEAELDVGHISTSNESGAA